jgi:orotidine-5'-phosphate decarboxylase
MTFREKLEAKWALGKFVCVGLDSEFERIPKIFNDSKLEMPAKIVCDSMGQFNELIVDQTHDLVCAYKPNFAFYGSEYAPGFIALQRTVKDIREKAPDVPVILDAKIGDIGNTSLHYAKMTFDRIGADAVTVSPYMGEDALRPFLERKDKGVIVLCRTSNPGAAEMQDVYVNLGGNTYIPYYLYVARMVKKWNEKYGNCALVVGATVPDQLADVREEVGDMPILIPGVGAQGGDLGQTIAAGKDARSAGMIINSSRGIIFADNPRAETQKLHDAVNECLSEPCTTCGKLQVRTKNGAWVCPDECGRTHQNP